MLHLIKNLEIRELLLKKMGRFVRKRLIYSVVLMNILVEEHSKLCSL